jgi:hypothetical protein
MQQGLAARGHYVDFNSHSSTDILILTVILHKLVHVSVKFFVYGRKREFFFIHFRNQMLQQAFKTHDNLSDCLIYICLHICIIIKPIHTRLFYPE